MTEAVVHSIHTVVTDGSDVYTLVHNLGVFDPVISIYDGETGEILLGGRGRVLDENSLTVVIAGTGETFRVVLSK